MTERPGVSRRHLLISGGLVVTAPLLGAARRAPAQTDSIVDAPGTHNFFMFGSKALYVSHMPMFTVEKHMYQVILRASLPDAVMRGYLAGQGAGRPTWNLVNSAEEYALPQIKAGTLTSFEVDVYKDYSNADAAPVGPPMARNVTLTVDEVVHFRHFDFDIPRPHHSTQPAVRAGR